MVETLKIASMGAELLNVGSKIIHKKGLFVVFNLSDEAAELSSFNAVAFKAEWLGADVKANMQVVVNKVKSKLDLENKDAEAKIKQWLDLSIDAAEVISKAGVLVEKVKALV